MYLYNSATHKKEEFTTHTPGRVGAGAHGHLSHLAGAPCKACGYGPLHRAQLFRAALLRLSEQGVNAVLKNYERAVKPLKIPCIPALERVQ